MKEKRFNKFILPALGFLIVLIFLLLGIFQYNSSKVDYDALEQREFTVLSYRYVSHVRGGSYHEIYVVEEKNPLRIDSEVDKVIDLTILEEAEKGDILVVWVTPIATKNGIRKVYEGTLNGAEFLSLEEYQKQSRENGLVGILLSSVLGVAVFGLSIWYFVDKRKKK